jgi:Phosphoribosylaminoimidazole carboxylase (NCAIR synthetase)
VLLNEVAPRPHNSGHWSIEGAVTSQFEHHVRAVLGLPLGETTARAPSATANLLGGEGLDGRQPVVGFETGAATDVRSGEATVDGESGVVLAGVADLLAAGDATLHWYGKRAVYPLRKTGHVTVSREDDPEAVLADARAHADRLRFERTEADTP